MDYRTTLKELCLQSLNERNLADEAHKLRLKQEFKEIDAQAEHEYLVGLHTKKAKFPKNEHNLLVAHLLGLCDDFDITQEYAWAQGEFPDIDIDYIKEVRDYLKKVWAPDKYGRENVCEIGTYGTLGIKSAILDMTRVHGLPREEIQAITSKMEDKDEDGKLLDWESACRVYPEFAAYCEKNPDVAKAAQESIDRNKTGGVHAGGLIIADRRIDEFVPLEVRSVKKEQPLGVLCSAWTEGLAHQDLQPVGLIKFDLLVINNLDQISRCCKLIKERHPEMKGICAKPGMWDWSDTSYLNDPLSIEMANRADLACIFQFDGQGIQKLVKRGGVTSFDDLVAYSALYRPGPLNMGMDARYCKRKRGEEPYALHPAMQPILGRTYGVMVFQEQVMDILRVVGKIPDMHTEKVRKAISKKKIAQFAKYKEMFLTNGQEVLGVNKKFLSDLWDQIESFAEYGFNKSHAAAYSFISARLLWLKTHYPIEFYAAILMCEGQTEKYKDYKLDAKKHGVAVRPVHINKSKANFAITDNEIFFGFENIKGIGHEVACRIVEHQPYKSFVDFLNKFGTDAAAIQRLIALGCFDELEPNYDHVTLRKFHEWYKDFATKQRQRQQRFEKRVVDLDLKLRDTLLEEITENDPDFEAMCKWDEAAADLWEKRFEQVMRDVQYKSKGAVKIKKVSLYKILMDQANARERSLKTNEEKEKFNDETPVTLDNFNPHNIELDADEIELLLTKRTIDGETSYPLAESQFYGFQWVHELETSPDYVGDTIDKFLQECEEDGVVCGPVEVVIKAVRKRTSKNGKTEFYSIDIEDANARLMTVNVWMDDFVRFQEDFKQDKMLRMRVRPPSGGFNTLTFDSVPKRERYKLPKTREEDYRIVELKKPLPPKVVEVDLEQFKFDASAIEGLEGLD